MIGKAFPAVLRDDNLQRRVENQVALNRKLEAARTSLAAFERACILDERGEPLRESQASDLLTAAIEYVITRWEGCDKDPAVTLNLNVVTMPGMGKTTKLRDGIVWQLGRDPFIRTVAASGDKTVAENMVSSCRSIITQEAPGDVVEMTGIKTPLFQRVFPEAKPDMRRSTVREGGQRGWRRDEFFFQTQSQGIDATMTASAAIPSAEARRVDILWADDIISEKIANSKAERDKVIGAFHNTWLDGRLIQMDKTGLCLHAQNVRNKHDLAHNLVGNPRFLSLWIGVYPDLSGGFIRLNNCPDDFPLVMDPERYGATPTQPAPLPHDKRETWQHEYRVPLEWTGMSEAQIMAKEPATRRKLVMLQASDPEDMAFPSFAKRTIIPATVAEILECEERGGFPLFDEVTRARTITMGGIDWSSQKRPGVRLFFWTKLHTGKMVPSYHRVIKGVQDLVDSLDLLWSLGWRWDRLFSESNATQGQIAEAIKMINRAFNHDNSWAHTIRPFMTGDNKHNASFGVQSMDGAFDSGMILWPGKEADRNRDWRILENEFGSCDEAALLSGTPDSIMAAWFPFRAISAMAVESRSSPPRGVAKGASRFSGY